MIWLLIVIVVALAIALAVGYHNSPRDAAAYRAGVELRAIHRRQEVAQFKGEVRREAADARRTLRAELDQLNKQGRL